MEHVVYRLVGERDIEPIVALMRKIGVHFAGNGSREVLRAVASDAVRDPSQVIIAVAEADGLAGLVVAFTERTRYWRAFARNHPRAALSVGAHRLARTARRLARKFRGPGDVDSSIAARISDGRRLLAGRLEPAGSESWEDEGRNVAKVMYVAVDPDRRGGGLGGSLYHWFFRYLAGTGFQRCDAHVSADNVAAISLHKRFPFRFVEVPGGYFLWLRPPEVEER